MPTKHFTLDELHKIRFHWQLPPEVQDKLDGYFINYGPYQQIIDAVQASARYNFVLTSRGSTFIIERVTEAQPDHQVLCSFRLMQRGYPGVALFKSVRELSAHALATFAPFGSTVPVARTGFTLNARHGQQGVYNK